MGSVVISASIPEEKRALWERLSESHRGSSKFVQWVLSTLAPVETEGMDAQARALRAASIRARMEFLQANVQAEHQELAQLGLLAGDTPVPAPVRLDPETWWVRAAAQHRVEWLLSLGPRQVQAMARQAGADPEACEALVRQKRDRSAEAFAERLRPGPG